MHFKKRSLHLFMVPGKQWGMNLPGIFLGNLFSRVFPSRLDQISLTVQPQKVFILIGLGHGVTQSLF